MTQATEPGATTTAGTPAAPAAQAPAQNPAAQAATPDPQKTAADARTAERARMSGILNCEEAKGREGLANHLAMKTDMSVEDAKVALAAAPKAEAAEPATPAANGFEAAMNKDGHPNVGATAGGGEGDQMSAADRILAAQAAATGWKPTTK